MVFYCKAWPGIRHSTCLCLVGKVQETASSCNLPVTNYWKLSWVFSPSLGVWRRQNLSPAGLQLCYRAQSRGSGAGSPAGPWWWQGQRSVGRQRHLQSLLLRTPWYLSVFSHSFHKDSPLEDFTHLWFFFFFNMLPLLNVFVSRQLYCLLSTLYSSGTFCVLVMI